MKFEVKLTGSKQPRKRFYSATVEVEAASEDEAKEIARDMTESDIGWEEDIDDWDGQSPIEIDDIEVEGEIEEGV